MISREDIVREALEWIGTPFLWGQSTKGRGCDCKGLIFGVARELGMPEADIPIAAKKAYQGISGAMLLEGMRATMVRTMDPLPADVILIKAGPKKQPMHLAMIINDRELVHCYGATLAKVVRVPIGRSRPIHSYWTWPSLMRE